MGIFERAARIAKSYWYGLEDEDDPYERIKKSEDDELKQIIEELNNPGKKTEEDPPGEKANSGERHSGYGAQQRHSHHAGSHQHANRSSVSNKDLYNACKVLGVGVNASVEEVKAAYKKKILRYHPDRVATLGAEEKAQAERFSREINHAYQVMKKHRGF